MVKKLITNIGLVTIVTEQPGDDNSLGQDPAKQAQQQLQQFAQQMQQLAQAVQTDTQFIQQQKQKNSNYDQHMQEIVKLAAEVQKLVEQGGQKAIAIPYQHSPYSVQRQIEQRHGLTPAPDAERAPLKLNGS